MQLSLSDDRYLFPVMITVEGYGYSLGSKQDTVRLRYSTIQFEPSGSEALGNHIQNSKTHDLQPSPGMFCFAQNLSRITFLCK